MKFDKRTKGLALILLAVMFGLMAAYMVLDAARKMEPNTPVYVASQTIDKGDPLKKDMFRVIMLPENGVPRDRINPADDFPTAIATTKMIDGDIFRTPHLLILEENHPSLFSARLRSLDDSSLRAIEVPIASQIRGLLSGMENYDNIDIISARKVEIPLEGAPEDTLAKTEEDLEVKTILRGVPVIGSRSVANDEGNMILVVALNEQQIETLIYYKASGEIHASLRPFGLHTEIYEEDIELIEEEKVEEEPIEQENEVLFPDQSN